MPSLVPQRGIRVEDDLYDKMCYIAEQENRSFNQQAVYVFRKYVAEYEKEHGPIKISEEK